MLQPLQLRLQVLIIPANETIETSKKSILTSHLHLRTFLFQNLIFCYNFGYLTLNFMDSPIFHLKESLWKIKRFLKQVDSLAIRLEYTVKVRQLFFIIAWLLRDPSIIRSNGHVHFLKLVKWKSPITRQLCLNLTWRSKVIVRDSSVSGSHMSMRADSAIQLSRPVIWDVEWSAPTNRKKSIHRDITEIKSRIVTWNKGGFGKGPSIA